MLPIFWRYALKSYLRIFCFATSAFLAVLVVSRFKEIARFSALSADWLKTAWFLVYQFPLILPIAIPISVLISALLFSQTLSRTREITALRASGLSLYGIFCPLFVASLFLSAFNLWLAAEISPACKRETKDLFYQESSENPLVLMQRQKLVKVEGIYLDLQVKEEGKKAEDLILVAYQGGNQRLSLLSASQLLIQDEALIGKEVALITHLPSEEISSFEPLVIENQKLVSTAAPIVSMALKKETPRPQAPALTFPLLLQQIQEVGKPGKVARTELLRRLSLCMAVFSFTLLGCAYGTEMGRDNSSKKGVRTALLLASIVFLSYLLGKQLRDSLIALILGFFLPHLLIWICSLRRLQRLSRGLS